jgi:hypothetical protein
MSRELRSSDFAFLLLIYFLLCSGRGRSRDSGSNRRSMSSPPKGPFGSLPLWRTRVLWCWCPPPLRYQIYTNSLAPTSWKDSQLQDEKKIWRERVKRDKSHFQLLYLAKYSEAIKTRFLQLKPSVMATVPHAFVVAVTRHIFVFLISFHC